MQTTNSSSAIFGKYSFFSKMDQPLDVPESTHIGARSHHLSYYIALACILLGAYFFKSHQDAKKRRVDVPYYKASLLKWIFDAETQVMQSYKKYYGQAYQIKATEGTQILLPPTLVGDVKGLPEDTLSATAAVSEAMMSEYTHFHLGNNGDLMSTLVRTKLAQHISRIVPKLKEEIDVLVATEFPECNDWTPFKIQPFTLRAVARMGGRIFVGPDINRIEEWVNTHVNFVVNVFTAVVKLQFIPPFLRPVGKYLIPDLRRITEDLDRARKMLQPILDERIRDMESCPGYEPPEDLISWLLETLPPHERADGAIHAQLQLVLSTASIHTTNNMVVDCIYDLAENLDVQEELRAEAEAAYNSGTPGTGWTKDKISQLKKMDSFMKEVQRFRGNITGFIRKVMKPISLSDGTQLPAGTKLLVPQAGVSRDEQYYESPDTFDALRFYKLRQQQQQQDDEGSPAPGHADRNRWHFTSIGDTNMNFGAGKHACPGRFFAATEIKLLLAYFLRGYDMRLKPGEGRPKGFCMMMSKVPDPKGEIEFRRRECTDY